MPYIKQEDYDRATDKPETPGELNFAITIRIIEYLTVVEKSNVDLFNEVTILVNEYLDRVGLSYTNGNAVMGVLSCAARELKRRMMDSPQAEADELVKRATKKLETVADIIYAGTLAPYEDTKIEENGDVYFPGKTL